jgi:hypothetical protein
VGEHGGYRDLRVRSRAHPQESHGPVAIICRRDPGPAALLRIKGLLVRAWVGPHVSGRGEIVTVIPLSGVIASHLNM